MNEAYDILGKLGKDEKEKKELNQKFITTMKLAAKYGNLHAQNTLSTIYSSETNSKFYFIDVNPEEAIYYIKLAAIMNEDVVALTKLGAISENEEEKLAILMKASSKGFPPAMLEVGYHYHEQEMYNVALLWYICGMNRGHAGSCLEVGGYYLMSFGVDKNEKLGNQIIKEAKKWDSALESFDEQILKIEKESVTKVETNSPTLNEPDLKLNDISSPMEENKPEIDSIFDQNDHSSSTNSEKDFEDSEVISTTSTESPRLKLTKNKKKEEPTSFWTTITYGLGITFGIAISVALWNKIRKEEK